MAEHCGIIECRCVGSLAARLQGAQVELQLGALSFLLGSVRERYNHDPTKTGIVRCARAKLHLS
jgi:hypothetical protein